MDRNPQLGSAVMSATFCCAVHRIVRQLPFVPGLLDLCVRQHMLVFALPEFVYDFFLPAATFLRVPLERLNIDWDVIIRII